MDNSKVAAKSMDKKASEVGLIVYASPLMILVYTFHLPICRYSIQYICLLCLMTVEFPGSLD